MWSIFINLRGIRQAMPGRRLTYYTEREIENCPNLYLVDSVERGIKDVLKTKQANSEFEDEISSFVLLWCKHKIIEDAKSIFNVLDYI